MIAHADGVHHVRARLSEDEGPAVGKSRGGVGRRAVGRVVDGSARRHDARGRAGDADRDADDVGPARHADGGLASLD